MKHELDQAPPTSVAASGDGSASADAAWHAFELAEVGRRLHTDLENGLDDSEVTRRRKKFGPNILVQAPGRSIASILLAQFRSLIVLLLVAATVIAFSVGDTIEGIAILIVILLNAGIGFITEWRAEQALSALQKQTVPVANVIRGGTDQQIEAAELVPGDLVVLDAGSRVPADGRLVETVRLQVEEAALTGESHAVVKAVQPVPDPHAPLGDRLCMAFMGTTITNGRGKMVVTDIGARTEVGRIGTMIDEAKNEATPLEKKLARLGRLLVVIVLFLCGVIVLMGWWRGTMDFWHMLELGISLAIAAVPEGLPAVATMTLALGMQRMARLGALIRRLPAVETLGSTTIICSDKTGTLTKNEMTVCAIVLRERRLEVTGSGYQRTGEFRSGEEVVNPQQDEGLELLLRIGLLCNDAHLEQQDDQVTVIGDPTEAAFVVAAEKGGLQRDDLQERYPRVDEIPFDSAAQYMATVHETPDGTVRAYVKGSPGKLLEASRQQWTSSGVQPLTEADRKFWDQANRELAGSALRVLALAYRDLPSGHQGQDLAQDLVFVGLAGMMDPLRDEIEQAIATCRVAGIRAMMITGDQQATAAEIARQLGIDRGPNGEPLRTVHARELVGLEGDGWRKVVAESGVFARVSPEHKLRIVEALQLDGHVVAMTGDGVNDAPALKKADIGVAMGIKGTEVAKETSDMIITDDNFATIVVAVEQGRIIYANILKFIHYLFSCNLSEILTVFLALMLGWPAPLQALQILWLNMITDVFPAMALALEPSAPDIMKRHPRDPRQPLLTPRFMALIAGQGLLLTLLTLTALYIAMQWYGREGDGIKHATTIAFMTLALAQVFHTFNARSQTRSIFNRQLFTNRWLWSAIVVCLLLQFGAVYTGFLQRVLHTTPLGLQDWGLILVCSLTPLLVMEIAKGVWRWLGRGGGPEGWG